MRRQVTRNSVAIAAGCAMTLSLAACQGAQLKTAQQLQTENVKLVWKQASNEWKVQLNGGPEISPGAARTKVDYASGPVIFIIDVAGKAARFKNPGGLSVWTGPKTVPAPAGVNSPEILGPIITSKNKMIFFDMNQGPAVTLNYALHFTDKPSVDPIIDNGGGKEY